MLIYKLLAIVVFGLFCCSANTAQAKSHSVHHAIHIDMAVEHNSHIFTYKVKNAVNSISIYDVTIAFAADVIEIKDPIGWTHETDGHSVVTWSPASNDPQFVDFPNKFAIAPGTEVNGFIIITKTTGSFNNNCHLGSLIGGTTGPSFDGIIEAPYDSAQVQDGL